MTININKIYVYHYDALTLIPNLLKKKQCFLGDQMHEPRILRRKFLKNIFVRITLDLIDTCMFKLVQYQLLKI